MNGATSLAIAAVGVLILLGVLRLTWASREPFRLRAGVWLTRVFLVGVAILLAYGFLHGATP